MSNLKGGVKMALVKAKMAFYHDSVGTRAANEIFEVKNENTCSELERAGYIQKVEGQEAQVHQERQQLQQEVGQINAKANEAVSMAHHTQNQQANQHHETVKQLRQQQTQQQPKATAKKADK